MIARHRRSYQREDMVFNPLHYLALLEQKTRAGPGGAAGGLGVAGRLRPMRRLMEARLNKKGKREYVQVLRLLETFALRRSKRPSTMRCEWARSASMPSSICCCAASSGGHRGWIWRTIRICPWPT